MNFARPNGGYLPLKARNFPPKRYFSSKRWTCGGRFPPKWWFLTQYLVWAPWLHVSLNTILIRPLLNRIFLWHHNSYQEGLGNEKMQKSGKQHFFWRGYRGSTFCSNSMASNHTYHNSWLFISSSLLAYVFKPAFLAQLFFLAFAVWCMLLPFSSFAFYSSLIALVFVVVSES